MRHSPGTSDNAGNSPARPAMQGTGDRSNDLTTQPLNRTKAPTPATGVMSAAMAMPGNTACTYLIHHFGGGLDGDDRFVVERRDPPGPAPRPEGERSADGGAHRGLLQRGGGDAPGPDGDHHRDGALHPRRHPGAGALAMGLLCNYHQKG